MMRAGTGMAAVRFRRCEGSCEMTADLPEVRRMGGYIGAEISGLDLTRDYPGATYAAIRRAWAEHGVIFFRDQFPDEDQRERFALRFGQIRTKQQLRREP